MHWERESRAGKVSCGNGSGGRGRGCVESTLRASASGLYGRRALTVLLCLLHAEPDT